MPTWLAFNGLWNRMRFSSRRCSSLAGRWATCTVGAKSLLLVSRFSILTSPLTVAPGSLRAEDRRTYHDKRNNDEHHWDSHEDRAYRMWVKENHRKAVDFSKLKEDDRQAYWAWRHEHSDARLKIDIHWPLNRFSGPRPPASMAARSLFF